MPGPRSIALAVCALLIPTSAFSGVVYNWVNLVPDATLGLLYGRIEFSDDVWSLGGSLNATVASGEGGLVNIKDSPATAVDFAQLSGPPEGQFQRIHWYGELCGVNPDCALYGMDSSDYFLLDFNVAAGTFGVDFGVFLRGNMNLNNAATNIYMETDGGPVWTITSITSDGPGCHDYPCSGSTGLWVLDPTTIPVPEPTMLTLLGLGIAQLAAPILKSR